MRRPVRLLLGFLFGILLGLLPGLVQAQAVSTDDPWCREQRAGRDRAVHCEVREYALPARGRHVVNAGQNGGIRVEAWDRAEVRLRARVSVEAPTAAAARRLADRVTVETGATIRPRVPETRSADRTSASVSFELMVPRRTDLDLTASNGGITVEGVRGRLRFQTTNGGISLARLGGDVRGQTTNGGVSVALAGSTWDGAGLDVEAVNGGVSLTVPDGYSAELVASTVNGRIRSDLGGALRAEQGEVRTTLGRGGPRLRLATVNGGVSIGRN